MRIRVIDAFAQPLPDGADADWALPSFTPAGERNVCGRATLATAHALHPASVRRSASAS